MISLYSAKSQISVFYGYDKEYCETKVESCIDCWSNYDATATYDRFANTSMNDFSLQLCCSQYGFFGMTEEFCQETDCLIQAAKAITLSQKLHFCALS